ncbi:MAG: hypothetical protein M1449_12405 [Candidatus Thermoplasmatota archaeon]|mgnify:CR=1 FL=1|nr:hypothetical protein [Candidatus Thermoplasmatota archaeon]
MRKPFHDFLNPPEVKGGGQRRYWIAVVAWLVMMLTTLIILSGILLAVVAILETRMGTEALRPYDMWLFMSLIFVLIASILLSDQLWGRLFVKSGYLSPEAVVRIRTNRAPTAKGEKIHRRISLSLSILIPVFLVCVGWYLHSWWMMGLAALLGVWLFVSVWAGWKKADAMIEGKLPPPEGADRVLRDIEHQAEEDEASPR